MRLKPALLVMIACVASACVASACGRDSGTDLRLPAPPEEPAVSVLLLDPAGRLLDVSHEPELYLVRDGKAAEIYTWDEGALHRLEDAPVDGAELLVLVAGCRPARVPLHAGRNVVRLEAGFRVRVQVSGEPPELPRVATMGLALERYVETIAGITLPRPTNLTTLAADAFDADMPTHPQYMRLPTGNVLDVLVPEAGVYRHRFDMRVPNGSYNTGHRQRNHEIPSHLKRLEIPWPSAEIRKLIESWRKRR